MTKFKGRYSWLDKILVFFVIIGILLIAGTIMLYKHDIRKIKKEKHEILATIAGMKTDQINFWFERRLGEINVILESPYLKNNVSNWLKTRNDSISLSPFFEAIMISSRLKFFLKEFSFSRILK